VVTQPDAAPLVESPLVDSSDEDLDDSSAGRERAAGPVGGGTGRSSAWRCVWHMGLLTCITVTHCCHMKLLEIRAYSVVTSHSSRLQAQQKLI
jgi:hypothetical protein